MDPARLFLYDDRVARNWFPFSLTRPVGEMLLGTETMRARVERIFGVRCRGHLAGSDLLGFEEPDAPPCTTVDVADANGVRLYLNSRFLPARSDARSSVAAARCQRPVVFAVGSTLVGACVPPGTRFPMGLLKSDAPSGWPVQPVTGQLLHSVWQMIAVNGDHIRRDAALLPDADLPKGAYRIGKERIAAADDAYVEPGTVFDASAGPIVLARGARVLGPARVTGPLYLGQGSSILGGSVGNASIGPACRVRGEVTHAIVIGYSNKAHDGFLGHSIVGRWVNLGALTTNSDLKNTYTPVRRLGSARLDPGLLKVGCFLGDHVRTGIGTLLNTGTMVGAGSNLFGGGMPPRNVPPFSWGTASHLAEYDIDRFLETAARVMARRGVRMTNGVRRLYHNAFVATASLRKLAGSS